MLNNIVDNIEQYGQHNVVFENPEQFVRFLLCIVHFLCLEKTCGVHNPKHAAHKVIV